VDVHVHAAVLASVPKLLGITVTMIPYHPNITRGVTMKSIHKFAIVAVAAAMLAGCAGMSGQDRDTAAGAGIGAVGGAILTGGSPLGVVGGAAVGGVVGHEVGKDKP
jgi:osmotically inducible lipoprotein OsmB